MRGRGGWSSSPGSGSSAPSASAGQYVAAEVDGEDLQGVERDDRQAGERGEHDREQLADVVREQVDEKALDVLVDRAAPLDRPHDRGEGVVEQDHHGRLLGDVGPAEAHRHPDVGPPERGRVVDPITGHGDNLIQGLEAVDDPQLVRRRDAGAQQLAPGADGAQPLRERGLVERLEVDRP